MRRLFVATALAGALAAFGGCDETPPETPPDLERERIWDDERTEELGEEAEDLPEEVEEELDEAGEPYEDVERERALPEPEDGIEGDLDLGVPGAGTLAPRAIPLQQQVPPPEGPGHFPPPHPPARPMNPAPTLEPVPPVDDLLAPWPSEADDEDAGPPERLVPPGEAARRN